MKYEVISGCVIGGKGHKTGSIVEINDDIAKTLVSMGRIVAHKDEPKMENRSMGLEVSSEKPKTRLRKGK